MPGLAKESFRLPPNMIFCAVWFLNVLGETIV